MLESADALESGCVLKYSKRKVPLGRLASVLVVGVAPVAWAKAVVATIGAPIHRAIDNSAALPRRSVRVVVGRGSVNELLSIFLPPDLPWYK